VSEPGAFPEGFSVDAVDWLPSGARSGLIRVRGHRPPAVAGPLPELILEAGGETKRFVSLPDPRADRDPSAWRGAYVLDAKPAAEADEMWLEWPGQRRIPLPPLNVPIHQVQLAAEPDVEDAGGDEVVVDRAVLAERRARRAEAAEQAQARIAREALRAVEVLELRSSELEQRVTAAEAERDALREQAGASTGEAPDLRIEVLHAEIRELRAALAELEAAPAPAPAAAPPPIAAGEGERRAERLRAALTATVATVAELRLRLHEVEVARRTRDVARAADAVRLAVIERERTAMTAELEQARRGLEEARRSRDEAAAELEGVRAAYEDVQAQHRDLTAELGAARERMAELEAEVAAVGAEAERAARNADEAARAADIIDDLRAQLARAEVALTEAETARELAEAAALAAAAQRQAASVAAAASRPAPTSPAREGLADRHREGRDQPTFANEAPMGRISRKPRLEPPPSMPEAELAAAAEAQTQRAEAERAPDPQLAADIAAAQVKITTEADHPPADVARGRGGREYPPLRGALVKLAHDDPRSAGRLLAGLLRAQHAVLADPPEYDITIEEVGTFAVSPVGLTTLVSPIEKPRGRGSARFHLVGDALTLAETLSGVETKARRMRGPLRAHGKVREARRLTEEIQEVSLRDLVRAGADLDPELVLRGLSYAIRPAWTQGQVWVVELVIEDRTISVAARHSGGLTVTRGRKDGEPDAGVRMTADAFRDLVVGGNPSVHVEGDETVFRRLLSLAERARSGTS
jgi:hypothetical protein